MIRNATKLTADRRSAVPYAGCRYTGPDGRVWTFWSMAPGRKDHHWVTDGVTFALADEAGLVAGARAMMATARSLADLDRDRALKPGTLRMADEQYTGRGYETPSVLVVAGPPATAADAAVLARYALNGRPKLTLEQCAAEGRRQLAERHPHPQAA